METIDRKFVIVAVNPCKEGTKLVRFAIVFIQWIVRVFKLNAYTEKNAVLFVAKDRALPGAIERYIGECRRLGCGIEHINSVDLLYGRVRHFQKTIECRVPDTEMDCEIRRSIGGEGIK